MKKFIYIAKNELQRQFAHRVNIVAYIVGNATALFAQLVVWYVVFQEQEIIRGYNFGEMVSYVVVGWIIWYLTTSYGFEQIVAREIHLGTLTNLIIKPIHYFKYATAVALGRVLVALGVVLIQAVVYISLFHSYINELDPFRIPMLLIMMVFIFIIRLFISFIIGLSAFWTTEISGVYKLINVSIGVLSGSYFPLFLLPAFLSKTLLLLPFPYIFYYPVQFYLGKVDMSGAWWGFLIQLVWIILLFLIALFVWKRGLRRYESVGA